MTWFFVLLDFSFKNFEKKYVHFYDQLKMNLKQKNCDKNFKIYSTKIIEK